MFALRGGIVLANAAIVVLAITAVTLAARNERQASTANASKRVVAAAQAFLETLNAEQRGKAHIELNAKTRTVWSNLPTGVAMQVGAKERNGLKFGDMTPAQEKAALALLSAALSREGFEKVSAIVDADEALQQQSPPRQGAVRFGRKEYYVAVLGPPSPTTTWMLQFGGHHLAINVTYAGGAHVLAPTHTGTQPASYTIEGRNVRPLGDENDKAFALINALPEQQRVQAMIGAQVRNLVLGPGEDGKTIAPEGVKASGFSAPHRAQLLDLAGEWIRILGDEAAAAKMAEVKSHLDDTYFAWAGPTMAGSTAYFRIQGPTVFIEYAPQNTTDHIHTIYRDPTSDYATKAMAR